MTAKTRLFYQGDALLIIDVQKDFCAGGSLPVPDGDHVVPVLNNWIDMAAERLIPIYASRDWHPLGHISFEKNGGSWPAHCIQDSAGARFHPDLQLPEQTVKISKGVRFDRDQTSVFDETGFAERLALDGVERLWIGGLAQDVCVLSSVVDARNEGCEVKVILAATRAITEERGREALEKMAGVGAEVFPKLP